MATWDIPFRIPRRGAYPCGRGRYRARRTALCAGAPLYGIGFQSRVRRFDMDGTAEETLIETANGTHDNLEGISVWRDADGPAA